MASFPNAVVSFPTRNTGDVITAAFFNDPNAEIVAIEAGYLQGTAPLNSSNSTVVTLSVSGGQITFPAVQVPSAGVNTLDDYEEGVFTPTIGGVVSEVGQVYTNQEGRYIKIGSLVWASGYVVLSTLGTITGNVVIKGLPFTAETGALQFYTGEIQWQNTTTSFMGMKCQVPQATTRIDILSSTAVTTNSAASAPLQADLSNTTGFRFAVLYRASA